MIIIKNIDPQKTTLLVEGRLYTTTSPQFEDIMEGFDITGFLDVLPMV